eukprot:m.33377 g.33377  ORF g.33377 m.33377 type:complete len:183 (-) comp5097_c0_seq1:257-805(-)
MGKWARDSDEVIDKEIVRKVRSLYQQVKVKMDASTTAATPPLTLSAFVDAFSDEDKLLRRVFEFVVMEERISPRSRASRGRQEADSAPGSAAAMRHSLANPRVLLMAALLRARANLSAPQASGPHSHDSHGPAPMLSMPAAAAALPAVLAVASVQEALAATTAAALPHGLSMAPRRLPPPSS